MNTAVDPCVPLAEAPRTARVRTPRKRGVQASRNPTGPVAENPDKPTPKSADAGLGKLSVYVPLATLRKLTVATAAWGEDKSDIVSQALERTLSGIVFYDKNAPRTVNQSLPVTESAEARPTE